VGQPSALGLPRGGSEPSDSSSNDLDYPSPSKEESPTLTCRWRKREGTLTGEHLLNQLVQALTDNIQRISEREGPDSGLKLEEIPIYHGKNLGEWCTWTTDTKDCHAQYPRKYAMEESRVCHGISWCDNRIKLAWCTHIDYQDPSKLELTWEELKRYLKTWANPKVD
jgi:hypothetical protein